MSAHTRVIHTRRATITALPLYYSGHLKVKLEKEKEFKKYFAELRGTTLFFYNNDSQETYTVKQDLEKLESMELHSCNQDKIIFTVKLHTWEMQLKMSDAKSGEEWRAYILTVINKKLPRKVQLLPGQLKQLEDVLAKEKKREVPLPHPPLPPRPSFLSSASASNTPSPLSKDDTEPEVPGCFFNVTRLEAERMLEANPEYGAIILRPSALPNCYALTLRQQTARGPVMRNFRLTTTKAGFVIELDTPVTVSSLNDVLKYFLEKTDYRLHPYIMSHPYDTHLDVQTASSSILSTPKAVPQAEVAPVQRPNPKKEYAPCPPLPEEVENEYVVPEDECLEKPVSTKFIFDKQLQEVLKIRREAIYASSKEEELLYEEFQE